MAQSVVPERVVAQTDDVVAGEASLLYPFVKIDAIGPVDGALAVKDNLCRRSLGGIDAFLGSSEQGGKALDVRFLCLIGAARDKPVAALVGTGKVVPKHAIADLIAQLDKIGLRTIVRQRVQHLLGVVLHFGSQSLSRSSPVVSPTGRNPLFGNVSPCVAVEDVEQEVHAGILDALAKFFDVFKVLTGCQKVVVDLIVVGSGVYQQTDADAIPTSHLMDKGDHSVTVVGIDGVAFCIQPFVACSFIGRY